MEYWKPTVSGRAKTVLLEYIYMTALLQYIHWLYLMSGKCGGAMALPVSPSEAPLDSTLLGHVVFTHEVFFTWGYIIIHVHS